VEDTKQAEELAWLLEVVEEKLAARAGTRAAPAVDPVDRPARVGPPCPGGVAPYRAHHWLIPAGQEEAWTCVRCGQRKDPPAELDAPVLAAPSAREPRPGRAPTSRPRPGQVLSRR
jgi:hypothetical protein